MSEQVILRNSARCRSCGTHITSRHRHDFVSCKCGAIFIDGGLDYIRTGFHNSDDFESTAKFGRPLPRQDWKPYKSDQTVSNVHNKGQCYGDFCVVHNPSKHPMRDWPQRFDRGRTYRIAPDGTSRLDPDDPEYINQEKP